MHHNEDIFPNADKFDPSRWLDPVAARALEKHLVSFGKGARQCLGMPYTSLVSSSPIDLSLPYKPGADFKNRLAYCELYVTLGTIFRKFENLKADQIGPEDLIYDDYFSSFHPKNARRLHVVAG